MTTKRAAKILIFNPDGRVLILRRSGTHPHVPYTYDLPGGELDEGESPAVGLLREVREETGIIMKENDLTAIDTNELDAFGRHYHVTLFSAKLVSDPTVKLSFEHDEYKWLPPDEAKIVGIAYEPMIERFMRSKA